jgi:hypothetical protein
MTSHRAQCQGRHSSASCLADLVLLPEACRTPQVTTACGGPGSVLLCELTSHVREHEMLAMAGCLWPQNYSLFYLVVLEFELGLTFARQALSLETLHQPFFVLGIFKIGSC